jgi:hypothetical protein
MVPATKIARTSRCEVEYAWKCAVEYGRNVAGSLG